MAERRATQKNNLNQPKFLICGKTACDTESPPKRQNVENVENVENVGNVENGELSEQREQSQARLDYAESRERKRQSLKIKNPLADCHLAFL